MQTWLVGPLSPLTKSSAWDPMETTSEAKKTRWRKPCFCHCGRGTKGYIPSRERSHIRPGGSENHLQTQLEKGIYVSFQEGVAFFFLKQLQSAQDQKVYRVCSPLFRASSLTSVERDEYWQRFFARLDCVRCACPKAERRGGTRCCHGRSQAGDSPGLTERRS